MNVKTWAPLAIALSLGVVAAIVAKRSLHPRVVTASADSISVVVAKSEIPPGHAITSEEVTVQPIAGRKSPAGAFSNPSEVVGRVTSVPMLAGQPVVETLLASKGTMAGLAALVPSGQRAVTIDVSESSGMAGLLVPGCRVDVVGTQVASDPSKTVAKLFAQNVPVVAVGQRLSAAKPEGEKDSQGPARTVTLLVTPREAEALDIGLVAARIRLVLRNSSDTDETQDAGVVLADLIGEPAPPTPQPAPQPTVATAPPDTTQPVESVQLFDPPKPAEPVSPAHVVTVILGGEEHRVSFNKAQMDDSAVTDVSHQPAIPQ